MVSVHPHDAPEPRTPSWKRTPAERRAADFKRWLIRNRVLVRSAAIAFVLGLIAGSLALGVPRALGSAFILIKSQLSGSAGLKAEVLTVEGLKNLRQSDVAAALDIARGTPLLDIDVTELRARAMQLGWVQDATIVRVPPNRLHVVIKEYEPAILWEHDGRYFVADKTGHVIAPAERSLFLGLLRISGDGAPEAASDLEEWLQAFPDLAAQVNYCERVSNRRWNLHLSNQLVVELPDSGLDEALAVLMRMIRENDLLHKDIVTADLRDPSEPRLILGEDAARALSAPGGKP